MGRQKNKQIQSDKPFKFIKSKQKFDKIINQTDTAPQQAHEKPQSIKKDNKQQITIPKIQSIKKSIKRKQFAKISLNYIRITQKFNLPKENLYQLREVDLMFINTYHTKYLINKKTVLTEQFLEDAIVQLQTQSGRNYPINKDKVWLTDFIEQQYKHIKRLKNYHEFVDNIFNYWVSRRQELKFPLLRSLWRPNAQQVSFLYAFKLRQKQKRNLRKTNKIPQQFSIELSNELQTALYIVKSVKFRQQLKHKLNIIQFAGFHDQCASLGFRSHDASIHQFMQTLQKQRSHLNFDFNRQIKKCNKYIRNNSNIIKGDESSSSQHQQYIQNFSHSQKQEGVINFISTVANYAENYGLDYQNFFTFNDDESLSSFSYDSFDHNDPNSQKKLLKMDICYDDNFVYRKIHSESFSVCTDSSSNNIDFMDKKTKSIIGHYFGIDDNQQESKLDKDLFSNFKAFRQMNTYATQTDFQ